MSFLSRIMQRANAGSGIDRFVVPKAAGRLASRMEAPDAGEESQVAPMRRSPARREASATPPADEEGVKRAPDPAEQPEGEEPMAQKLPLRRAQVQPEEKEPAARSLRRATKPNDEDKAPARRTASAPPPEDEQNQVASRTIRRADEAFIDEGSRPLRQPFQSDALPGAAPPHQDLSDMEEPSPLQALRRNTMPLQDSGTTGSGSRGLTYSDSLVGDAVAPADFEPVSTSLSPWNGMANSESIPLHTATSMASSKNTQADVVIDRVDVIIHEPAPPPRPSSPPQNAGRLMRSRYLNRL